MADLFSQLGINLPSLLAQGVNFIIVLGVLTFFVYKPLARVVDERRARIEKGLADAKVAEEKLAGISALERERLAEAERTALAVIHQAEGKAGERGREIIASSELKASGIVKEAKTLAERQAAEEMVSLQKEAANFVKAAIVKTVELDPKLVDEKLIDEAVRVLRGART